MASPKDEIRFYASPKLAGYLRVLVRDTMLGKTMNLVAERLLTDATDRLFREDYHLKQVPTATAEELAAMEQKEQP